jgi:hypothetical protein
MTIEHTTRPRQVASSVEYRVTPLPVECRSGGLRIGGLAAVFGRRSRLLGDFHEQLDTGFFDEARAAGWCDIVCTAEHDNRLLLGAIHSGTLALAITAAGLDYECELPASRRDTFESVSRGDYGGSSFQFRCTCDTWEFRDSAPLRTLQSGRISQVGPVTRPAYPDSSVALRSLAAFKDASVEEVAALAERNELRSLFERSDRPPARRGMSYYDATLRLQALRWPDPDNRYR